MIRTWQWYGDGDLSRVFSDRDDAVEAAVAEFQLTDAQRAELDSSGWVLLSKHSHVEVFDPNDCADPG